MQFQFNEESSTELTKVLTKKRPPDATPTHPDCGCPICILGFLTEDWKN